MTWFQLMLAVSVAAAAQTAPAPTRINKISFLIHPVCWDLALGRDGTAHRYITSVENIRGGAWYESHEFQEILAWERRVNQKQKEYIERMRPDEAMILYPIGNKPAMRELIRFAEMTLGPRVVVIRSESPSGNMKVDYRTLLPAKARMELADELLETVRRNDDKWSAMALEVIFYNRMIAEEIRAEFGKRNLQFDPKTVKAVAFGEGFEQCAMTWKAMVPHYLGLAGPIENDFDLSVSGMPLLRGAKLRERVALANDVRLFLWELTDGRLMALYAKAQAHLVDPQLFVSLPFAPASVKVFDDGGRMTWPKAGTEEPVEPSPTGSLRVPVFFGLRQFSNDRPCYLVIDKMGFDEIRKALVNAEIRAVR
ncbi:MAG: hypothetical protein ACKV22_02930 [Bryobacteraceae bacterium]